uniref:Erythromycin esterase n=1 Tax=Cyanothece sp. (strain PCC 7425 / ATCC 29141) TaxID=395961 RepID=B8HJQ5_CYAP4
MAQPTIAQLTDSLRQFAYPLKGIDLDYGPLLDLIGEARFVLIGEATHGTHEFYQQRAVITQRLIQEKGFTAVAIEADWPDAYRVNRFVRGADDYPSPEDALRGGFQRFPTWMWRNLDVLKFVGWLRQYNDTRPRNKKVGFYGLDLYSLYTSIAEVIHYLEQVDPEAAAQARHRYACFEHFGTDSQLYGYVTAAGIAPSCEDETINQLLELQHRQGEYAPQDGFIAEDEFFYAEQNARLVRDAEEYYRSMFRGRELSWNLRDRHMAETLDQLVEHFGKQGHELKVVVWEHNSHLGDARATDMGRGGEWNVGQLVRQRYGQDAVLVGFTTYTGTVTAAANWDEPAQLKIVRPALPGSYEALFHDTGLAQFMLNLRQKNAAVEGLLERRLERAIGVIYRPETERHSHYFYACLPQQFDVVIHCDDTLAVEPLDRWADQSTGEAPETYPSAL